jgi:FAD binding domain
MKPAEQRIATSALVIGSGRSGLGAAIQVAERGADLLMVGKRPAIDAYTTPAACGINAALGTMDPEDSWQEHAADRLEEGYFLMDPQTVKSWPSRPAASRIWRGGHALRPRGRRAHLPAVLRRSHVPADRNRQRLWPRPGEHHNLLVPSSATTDRTDIRRWAEKGMSHG